LIREVKKMADIKEIKSVKLAPFALMSSTIQAILAFIAAVIILLVFGAVALLLPQLTIFGAVITAIGVALIIIYPISAFFINLSTSFFSALLYNALVPRLGGIKLGLEGEDVTEIPVMSFALILASIEAIWAFIIGLFLAASLAPITALLSSSIPVISRAIVTAINSTNITNITNSTNLTNLTNASHITNATIPTGAAVGTAGIVGALLLIIGLPILVFIVGFIVNALAAIFYNYLATKVAKVKLSFAAISGTLYELKSIPVVPTALSIAVVFAIFGLLQGLEQLIALSAVGKPLGGIEALIFDIVRSFVMYFIIVALAAIFYNYLAPRIGGIKLNLK
jgi:hypothetical protein